MNPAWTALAQVAPVDSVTGISVTSLVGSLGAAGAACLVTYWFLAAQRAQSEERRLERESDAEERRAERESFLAAQQEHQAKDQAFRERMGQEFRQELRTIVDRFMGQKRDG